MVEKAQKSEENAVDRLKSQLSSKPPPNHSTSTTAAFLIHTNFCSQVLQSVAYPLLPVLKYDSVFERIEPKVADIPAFIPFAVSEMFIFSDSPVECALLFIVAAVSEKPSFNVVPVLMALSLKTEALSFSLRPVFHALLARADPPSLAVSFNAETVFIVPALTVDADETSVCFK